MEGSPIRVLVTAFAVVPGSSPHASAVLGLASALHADVDLVTVKTDALSHMERIGDARMLRVPLGVASQTEQRKTFARAVRRQLDAEAYDVVHVRGPSEGVVVAERRESLGFRFIYEVASFPDENDGGQTEAAWLRAHQRCLSSADLVLVPTEAASRALAERGLAAKVAVVAPGVDTDRYDWRPFARSDPPRLLYLGSFAADRDLATLLRAVRAVARETPVTALIAGEPDPERRARMRMIVEAFALTEIVKVRGEPSVGSLPAIIGAADLCVAPASAVPRFQEHGDLPEPLLEYLACRRPVVSAAVPGVAEILRDEEEALLYTPADESTLGEAILTMLRDKALREHTVAQGYERVRRDFSSGARRRRMIEVYELLKVGSQRHDPWRTAFDVDSGHTTTASALVVGAGGSLPPDASQSPSEPTRSEYRQAGGLDTNPIVFGNADDGSDLSSMPTMLTRSDTSPGTPSPETDPGSLPDEPHTAERETGPMPGPDEGGPTGLPKERRSEKPPPRPANKP